MRVGFVSLGCSKNLVDTEMTIGLFKKNNFEIVADPEKADIIVINTCGFIDKAKEESINTIIEMAQYKKKKCKYLVAMGCLVQRYKEELQDLIPEVDLFIKYDSYNTIWDQLSKMIKEKEGKAKYKELDFNNRVVATGANYAYVRIAEGCNNNCAFCSIPQIRGNYTSRKKEDIEKEVKQLVKQGYKEIILIAQDTSKYGIDIYKKPMLADLLKTLCKIKNLKWIRFLYAYPETITDELIEVVKEEDKICKYFDIPMQHYSDKILKKMNRASTSKSIEKLINKIREEIPEAVIRTTVMVGFPGETEEDFEKLYNFIDNSKIDKLGAFEFSKEENTKAYKMRNQIENKVKKDRYNKIMRLQNKISKENLKNKIGNEYEVLVEGIADSNKYYIGRTYMDSPEIDGIVYIPKTRQNTLEIGSFVKVKIIETNDYDLVGKIEK